MFGVALTADGDYLLAVGATGAYVLSVPGVEEGSADPVVGTLSIPDELVDGRIEVVTSRDSRFAFVSVEFSDEIAVSISRRDGHEFRSSGFLGTIGLAASSPAWRSRPTEVAVRDQRRDGLSARRSS